MAYDWGRILAKAINGIFFHVAPNKQLKREESSTIHSMKKRGWSTLLWFVIQTRFKYLVTEVYFHNAIKLVRC